MEKKQKQSNILVTGLIGYFIFLLILFCPVVAIDAVSKNSLTPVGAYGALLIWIGILTILSAFLSRVRPSSY